MQWIITDLKVSNWLHQILNMQTGFLDISIAVVTKVSISVCPN